VQQLGVFLARLTQPYQPSPIPLSGRPAHRPFRGLLGVHSRCGLHTRVVTVFRDRYPGASDISSPPCLPRLLPAGAISSGGPCTHWKAPHCHGPRGNRTLGSRAAASPQPSVGHKSKRIWSSPERSGDSFEGGSGRCVRAQRAAAARKPSGDR